MPARSVGPVAWLDQTAADLAVQSAQPALDNVQQQVSQIGQQPAEPSFSSRIPNIGALLGGGPDSSQPQAAPQTPPPSGFASMLPSSVDDLLRPFGLGSAAPAPAASSAPAASGAPTTGMSGATRPVAASGTPQAMPTGAGATYGPPVGGGSGTIEGTDRPSRIASALQYARAAEARTGVPAEVNLAFAVHESGLEDRYGPGNSFHGRHAVEGEEGTPITDWGYDAAGNRVDYPTKLKRYQNAAGSFDDFADLIAGSPRYQPALARYQQTGDADQLIRDIWAAGYGESKTGPDETVDIRRNQVAPIGAQAPTAQPQRPQPTSGTPQAMPSTGGGSRAAYSGPYTQQALADAGDPDAWSKCGPVAAFQAAQILGRAPTPEEVERLARQRGWTAAAGMAGIKSEEGLLRDMNIAATAVEGPTDWNHVIADLRRGNPVLLQLPNNGGHYVTAQAYDEQTGEIDFGSTVGDLRAARHRTKFTPQQFEALGWGAPTGALYIDNPATPAPSVVAGRSAPTAGAPTPAASPSQATPAAAPTPPQPGPANPALTGLGGNPGAANYALDMSQPQDQPLPPSGSQPRADESIDPATGEPYGQPLNPDDLIYPYNRPGLQRLDGQPQPIPRSMPMPGLGGEGLMAAAAPQGVQRYQAIDMSGPPYDPRDADGGPRESGYRLPQPAPTIADPTITDPNYTGAAPWNGSGASSDVPPATPPVTTNVSTPTPTSVSLPATGGTAPSPNDDPGGAVQRAQDSQTQAPPPGVSPYDEVPPVVPPTPPTDPTITDPTYTQPPSTGYDPNDPSTYTPIDQPGAIRRTDLPPEMQVNQPGRIPYAPGPQQPTGGIQAPPGIADRYVPRAQQTAPQPATPENPPQPSRWDVPQSRPTPMPAEDAATELERPPSPYNPPPQNPVERAISSAGRAPFLNEPAAQQAVDIYNAIQELPFDVYATARRQLVSDVDARHMAGTDPLAPFRGLGIALPSPEELNPTGRPASDVAAGLLIAGALPDPTDPAVQVGLAALGKTLGVTARAARAVGRPAVGAVQQGAEALGRGARALGAGLDEAGRVAREANEADRLRPRGAGALGTLGVVSGNPLEANTAARTRIVPPHVADTLDFPVRIPDDPSVVRAIEAAGGSVDPERGVTLNVIRYQGPEAHGQAATRGMTFYTADRPGAPSPYATSAKGQTGGTDRVEGLTRFRSPLILSDAPGDARGFDDAMRRLGTPGQPDAATVDELYAQLQSTRNTWEAAQRGQGAMFGMSPDEWAKHAEAAYHDAFARWQAAQQGIPTSQQLNDAIRAARAAGPEGSPARATALKELVSRYGGDPEVIDDLLKVRGADASESAWAIKENIVATNARRQGYDGVVTVQTGSVSANDIATHPKVVAAQEARTQAIDALDRAKQHAELTGDPVPLREAFQAKTAADIAFNKAKREAMEELAQQGRITELADVREARNPTPGTASNAATQAELEYRRAQEAYLEARLGNYQNPPTHTTEQVQALATERNARYEAFQALKHDVAGPPGYTLRPDLPRRPSEGTVASGTAGVASTRGTGLAARALTDASNSLGGGIFGGAAGLAAPADSDEERRQHGLIGAGLGMVAGPLAGRAMRRGEGALGTFGAGPNGRRPQSVEAAQEALTVARQALATAKQSRDAGAVAVARQAESDAAAAVREARVRREQAIRSDFGRQQGGPLGDVTEGDARLRPSEQGDIGGPASMIPSTVGRQNAVGAGLGLGAGAETDENGDPIYDPVRGAGGALVAGAINWRHFPGAQKAVQAAAQRQARMAARGIKPLNPLQWTGELAKSVGYSSMIGLRTAVVNLSGNLGEPLWALPKEATRAALPQALGGRGNLNEFTAWLRGQGKGAKNVPGEAWNALRGEGRYASNPDQPNLSERTVNPIAHAAALLPELSGRVLSGLPDAIFGTIARGAGEEMAAVRIANDAGLKGTQHSQRVQQILADAKGLMAGIQPPDQLRLDDAQAVIRNGGAFANDMTYRNPLGTVSKGLEKASGRGIPVLGSLNTPFFTTPQNMNLRMLERTPVGAFMNTHNRPGTARTKFDRVYDTVVGSSILAGLYMGYVSQGYVTGSGPDDPEKRKELEATGWRAYSTLLTGPDGKSYYVPNRNIGNYGTILNALGDYHDAQVYQKPGGSLSGEMVRRFGKNLQDSPYASGWADLVHALDRPSEAGAQFVAGLASRLTPFAATNRDIATSQDPYERQIESGPDTGFWDEVGQRWRQATGIGRQDAAPKTDVRGQPVENAQQGWRAFVPKGVAYKPDPIISELLGKNVDLSQPRESFPVTVAGADAPDGGIGTRDLRLTPKERADWQRYRWQQIEQAFSMTQDPEFKNLPVSVQQRIWRSTVAAANRTADGMVKADIGDQWDSRVQAARPKAS